MKKLFVIGVVMAALLTIPLVVGAQEDLDATFVAPDDSYSFDYPESWFASEDDEDGTVMVSDGEQFFMLYSPAVLVDYGMGDFTDPTVMSLYGR